MIRSFFLVENCYRRRLIPTRVLLLLATVHFISLAHYIVVCIGEQRTMSNVKFNCYCLSN